MSMFPWVSSDLHTWKWAQWTHWLTKLDFGSPPVSSIFLISVLQFNPAGAQIIETGQLHLF